jgi:5-hydroxyisourate hydrolase-like protein (transthyretin family)
MKKKKTYQIWMVIEECTTDKDGNETYRDLEEETRSAGRYESVKDALEAMDEIHNERKHTYGN